MTLTPSFAPLRTLRDIEALEQENLESRLLSWDANDWIRRGLDRDPDKIAIRCVADGDPASPSVDVSYAALKRDSTRLANLFHALGVGPEEAVLTLLPTIPQFYSVNMAAMATGIACSVNWMLEPAHWIELIKASRARVVVALGPTPGFEIWDKLQAIRAEIPEDVRVLALQMPDAPAATDCDLNVLAAAQPDDRLSFVRRCGPDEVGAYIHSGGTTGAPKLVRLTHRGLSYKFWANTLVMAHTPNDVIFADYPMFHIAGFFARGILAIANGMTVVIPSPLGARDKRFIAHYWKFVERFRISILSGVPTTLAQLAKAPPQGEDISSLRPYAVTGSTAFPSEVARSLERQLGVRMMGSYGATEYTQNVAQPPRDGDPKYGAAGLRLPYTQIRIVELDDDGRIARDCDTDEIGLVVIKGPSVTPGYVDPRHNAGIFTADGWFNSGDLGRIDTDGYLWLTGRAKDVIIRGGHNIDPQVIEESLLKHPDVVLAAAVAKPDAYAGELPVAYVQLVAGARTTADDLIAFAQQHIPERAAVPKEIVVLAAMPLTDVGKPRKPQLRQDAARRAFSAALADIARGRVAVQMVPDAKQGQRAVITVDCDPAVRDAVSAAIAERMKAYPIPYELRWGVPAGAEVSP